MDFSNIFRLANLVVGGLMIVGALLVFFFDGISIRNVITAVYLIIFGLATAGLELLPQVPPYLPKYASFMFSFLGRGVFYIFMGGLILQHGTFSYIVGSLVIFAGIAYAAMEFVPSIEPPANMRDADAGWGAEQV